MSDQLTVHYTLLAKMNPDDPNEIRRYDCSECDEDVFNVNVHAQVEHGTLLFDIDGREKIRPYDLPPHPCGVGGCSWPANHPDIEHGGGHSWEPGAKAQGGA